MYSQQVDRSYTSNGKKAIITYVVWPVTPTSGAPTVMQPPTQQNCARDVNLGQSAQAIENRSMNQQHEATTVHVYK